MLGFVRIEEGDRDPQDLLKVQLSLDQLENRESPAVIAQGDFYTVRAGRTLSTQNIAGTGKFGKGGKNNGVLANDFDNTLFPNSGKFLNAQLISNPVDLGTGLPITTSFSFNNNGNGSFTFRAPRNFNSTVRFTYQAFNPSGTFSTTTNVDIRVIGPTRRIVVGADQGGAPRVQAFDQTGKTKVLDFMAFDPAFSGGVRVAAADFNGDNVDDIVCAAGPGGGPDVRIFDGVNGQLIKQFFAFDQAFTGGVQVATGDIDGDGQDELVCAADAGGGPDVRVFTLNNNTPPTLYAQFFAYDMSFSGGVRVAVADTSSDGFGRIVTAPGYGGGPDIRTFDLSDPTNPILEREFFAFDENRRDGANIAIGDFNGDFFDDYAVGTGSGTAAVVIFSGRDLKQFGTFYPGQQPVNPGLQSVNNGNQTTLLADLQYTPNNSENAAANQLDQVRPTSLVPNNLLSQSNVANRPGTLTSYTGGARIAVTYADRDNNADLAVTSGPGDYPRMRIYNGATGSVFYDTALYDELFYGGVWIAGHY